MKLLCISFLLSVFALNVKAGANVNASCTALLVNELQYQPLVTPLPLNDSIRLQTSEGKLALKALGQPPYLLHFWASWCRPCRPELQELSQHYQTINDNGSQVSPVSIDINGLAVIQKTLQQLGIADTLPAYSDADSVLFQASGGQVLPRTVFVNHRGIISHHYNGSSPWGDQTYQQLQRCLPPEGSHE